MYLKPILFDTIDSVENMEFFVNIKVPVTMLHVVAVVFGMGSAIVSDILFTFYSKDKVLNKTELRTLSILSKTVWYSLIFIAISGIFLFLSDVPKYTASVKFLAKMSVLAILVLNGFILDRLVWPHLKNKELLKLSLHRPKRKLAFVCGTISVISWISVLILGVLDSVNVSYIAILCLYLIILMIGIPISLFIEKKEFSSNL